ncbi:helix-turn-helix domain-containing protein [Chloroflexota bacterium]
MLQKHIAQYSEQELEALVQHLVTDEWPESMTLEYKSEQSFNRGARLEIAKDISSLANTKGGTIIYGIPERRISDGAEDTAIYQL